LIVGSTLPDRQAYHLMRSIITVVLLLGKEIDAW